jgi:hypothetical protein
MLFQARAYSQGHSGMASLRKHCIANDHLLVVSVQNQQFSCAGLRHASGISLALDSEDVAQVRIS